MLPRSHIGKLPLLDNIICFYEIKSITGFPVIDMWFMEVPYRTKIVQNILQHLALPTLVLCILPTMEIIRIIHQRAEYILNQNFSKVATTRVG